jgi:hypothetical protein
MSKRKTPAAPDFSEYERSDLWSEAELQALCCGLLPDGSRPATAELNRAADKISKAVIARKITPLPNPDATDGDRVFLRYRYFKPDEVIPWASAMFPLFPFRTKAAEKTAGDDREGHAAGHHRCPLKKSRD